MKAPQHTIIFECSGCGATHHSGVKKLPIGWSAIPGQGQAWCTDCTAAGQSGRTIRRPRKQAA